MLGETDDTFIAHVGCNVLMHKSLPNRSHTNHYLCRTAVVYVLGLRKTMFIRAILTFLRSESNTTMLFSDLAERGFNALIEAVKGAKLPYFAEWRWSSLEDSCLAITPCLGSLRLQVRAEIFRKVKDRTFRQNVS